MPRRAIVLENFQSPGDVVMLTAAVRDLHRAACGRFEVSVRTSAPELWENNPGLVAAATGAEVVRCNYPLVRESNRIPRHFIEGFHEYLGRKLEVQIKVTDFRGDIHLTESERARTSRFHLVAGLDVPFWILVAGGKYDFTAKWWNQIRMQNVIDNFRGRALFAQIGAETHHHPPLTGVIDLRGKTTMRELVVLMHHAQGVVCPVTLAMHLSAAVETRWGMPKVRPCVVIAGGREPPHWEAYPGHQFIHTVGSLSCCDRGGCWRSRVVPLGDGDDNDRSLCANVVRVDQFTGARVQEPAVPGEAFMARTGTEPLPRCMDMIGADEVIRRIEMYFDGGVVKPLSEREAKLCAERIPSLEWNSLLRATVQGASLSGITGSEAEPALLKNNRETQDRSDESEAEVFGTGATSGAAEEARPRLTVCMLAEGDDFEATRNGVNAVLTAFPRNEMSFFVAARSIGQRSRAHLARLRAEGLIDFFADYRGSADVLSLFCRLFERAETAFVCWFDQRTLITAEIVNSLTAGMETGKKIGIRAIPTAAGSMGAERCWLASREAIWSGDELPMPRAVPTKPNETNEREPKTSGSGFPTALDSIRSCQANVTR